MKRWVSILLFGYGVLTSAVLVTWFLLTCLGFYWIPRGKQIILIVACVHASVGVLTFQRNRSPKRARWLPVISPTSAGKTVARTLLTIALLLCLGTLVLLFTTRSNNERQSPIVMLCAISVFLVQTTYFAVHWAIRPENVFSPPFLRFASNPLGEMFLYFRRLKAK